MSSSNKQPFVYQPPEVKTIAQNYVKKDNKFIQTEQSKYDFMNADS